MVARITTAAFQGIDVQPVDVQVHISAGLPSFTIVGPITPRLKLLGSTEKQPLVVDAGLVRE